MGAHGAAPPIFRMESHVRHPRFRQLEPAMVGHLARRILQALIVVWAAYTLAFVIVYALPSDPVSLIVGPDASDLTPAQLDALRAQYGLDQPLPVQYLERLAALARGDLGTSFVSGRPVAELIREAVGPTLQVSALALALAVIGGSAVAIGATVTRHRWLATLLTALPPLGVAVPAFWLGLLLIQWFSFGLHIFPAIGDRSPAALVLPAVTLAVPTGAMLAQVLSKSLTATLREPFIETARAKGASRARTHLAHAPRNAALPAFTMLGLVVGQLLAGAVVTETVFSRPGLGRLAASAVMAQDIPVVLAVVLLAAIAFALTNLLVDLVYPFVDPRIARSSRGLTTTATAETDEAPRPSHDTDPVPVAAATRLHQEASA